MERCGEGSRANHNALFDGSRIPSFLSSLFLILKRSRTVIGVHKTPFEFLVSDS